MNDPRSSRNVDIEFLRVVAVLLIVFEHTSVLHDAFGVLSLRSVAGFGVGVDLFFAISGFVVADAFFARSAALRGASRVTQYVTFIGRRIARLAPAALVWIVITILLTVLINDPVSFRFIGETITGGYAALFSYANILAFRCESQLTFCSLLQPHWSLSLEMQFYLLAGLVLVTCSRRVVAGVMGVAAIVLLLDQRTMWSLADMFRMEGMALGVMLAALKPQLRHLTARSHGERWVLCVVTLGCIVNLPLFYAHPSRMPEQAIIVALLAIVPVAIAGANGRLFAPAPAIARLWSFVGSRSYAIYLVNFQVYALFRYWFDRGTILEFRLFILLLAVAAILVLADLTYRLVETPARARGYRLFSDPQRVAAISRTFLIALGAYIALAVISASLHVEDLFLNVRRARVGSYIAPKLDGKLVEITPFEWRAEDIPPPVAVRMTAQNLCRALGHKDVIFFWPARSPSPQVSRLVNFKDRTTRPFDRGLYHFQRLQCLG